MTLHFSIEYIANDHEFMHVILSGCYPDGSHWAYNLPLSTNDRHHWHIATNVLTQHFRHKSGARKPGESISFEYHYQIEDAEGKLLRREWSAVERRCQCGATHDIRLADLWREVPITAHLYTLAGRRLTSNSGSTPPTADVSPSADAPTAAMQPSKHSHTVVLTVQAPQLHADEQLVATGNHPALGDWQPKRGLEMKPQGRGEWSGWFDALAQTEPVEYKFAVMSRLTGQLLRWEDGQNRTTADCGPLPSEGEVLRADCGMLRIKEDELRAAGIMVPLFSLLSQGSCGVGDMGDLLLLVDWAASVGMRVVQLLPINDTTTQHSWHDSAPYNIISAYALHPHYLDLRQLPMPEEAEWTKDYRRQCSELNALGLTDYEAVERVKWLYIDKVYALSGEQTLAADGFKDFFKANEHWLRPYAAFCVLRDKYGTARTSDWGIHSEYDSDLPDKLMREDEQLADAMRKMWYVQYFLHRQLSRVAQRARSKGVVLKADLPVAPYRDSVATWIDGRNFSLDMRMGTPPTPSLPAGQVWGFATAASAYRQKWVERHLRYLEQYFDAVRIDHVAAFFSTWEVPGHAVSAALGHPTPACPMTADEIRQKGFQFDQRLHAAPVITDEMLRSVFADESQNVAQHYLRRRTRGNYSMRSDYSTQQRVFEAFGYNAQGRDKWLRDGLCRLLEQVLFVEDPRQWGHYHPRYGATGDLVFALLTPDEQRAYAAIHDDYYRYRHQALWAGEARRDLSALQQATRLLLCVEDLGALPDGAEWVFDSEKLLTLEVLTVGKHRGSEFSLPANYPYRSVATTSTHDTLPLRMWWQADNERSQRLMQEMMHSSNKAPRILSPGMAEEIIVRMMGSKAMLCVLPLQDWIAIDGTLRSNEAQSERINNPKDGQNRWCYRMPLSIERLAEDTFFSRRVAQIIANSGR